MQSMSLHPPQPPNYYTILGLPSPDSSNRPPTPQTIKAGYRTSLLKHHPDKSHPVLPTSTTAPLYTIDQITTAYTTLSTPSLRTTYDRSLILSLSKNPPYTSYTSQSSETFKTGVEIVDLDDLSFDEKGQMWYRECRCGDKKGFVVREGDLEAAEEFGEVEVQCGGCSLWMRVQFGVEDE